MSEPTFEIVFRGKLLRDFDRATVVNNLMALFRIDAARVEAMLGQTKLVLKRGLGRDAAQRYQDLLRQAGIMVAAVIETPAGGSEVAPAPAAVPAAPTPMAARPPVTQPPAVAAARAPTATDAGNLTLAPVGSQVLEGHSRPVARQYDLSALSLDAPGATLVEKKPAPARSFDTSLLELTPLPVQNEPEAPPSALTRKLYSDS